MVHNSAVFSAFLNDELPEIFCWAYQWKMIFNPYVSKQAQEIVFSHKANASNHKTVYFKSLPVIRKNIQKHLGLFLDSKLSFLDHINEKTKKATKGVNVIRKINLLLPLSSLLTIYKSFVRPHLDYGNVIYHQSNNSRLSILVVFKMPVVGLNFSKIRFHHIPLPNGINWILILKILIPIQCSVKSF